MSVKRQATTDLNHENWDQEDPSEHEEMGTFKPAAKDVLEKRVIKTAKRRSQLSSGDEEKKGVFSGFGGFNKTQPSSFDFLANLTNGNKNTNGSTATKSETTLATSVFSTNNSGGGLFSSQTSPLSSIKTSFGAPMSQSTTLFGGSPVNKTSTTPLMFSASNTDSTVGNNIFKSPLSSVETTSQEKDSSNKTTISANLVPTNIFGGSSTSSNTSVSNVSNTNLASPTTKSMGSTSISHPNVENKESSTNINTNNAGESEKENKQSAYFNKLRGLNVSVSDWIKQHVEETPLCILTPIFNDYNKYLKEIQDECYDSDSEDKTELKTSEPMSELKDNVQQVAKSESTVAGSLFSNYIPVSKPSVFSLGNNTKLADKPSSSTFSLGAKPSTESSNPIFNSGSGASSISTNTTSLFSFGTNTSTTNTVGSSTFSFGGGKPFSFNTNIQTNTEKKEEAKEEDDEPPKVEYTPVVEENSIFDKRCKVFIKKDGNFVDKGVGTLYIKKVEDSEKHQLLIRANTNLGTVLLNLILATAIPTQRMGKNNVMLVCIPTPDAKPPPTPILIRVKTSEEADELLETLNKYKG